ncbi:hypothetical protein [Streptomyces racemochromogenes]|uniref:hypothetical protein n=1 Tax=Streptomyces racemochromogenes TaxID=67353 RepID=UPI0035E7E231
MAFNRTTVSGTSALSGTVQPIVEDIFPHSQGGEQPEPAEDSGTSEVPESVSSEVPNFGSSDDDQPKWKTLERKEVRLRAGQLTDLAELRRRVSAQRTDKSEIITDNTLIRIAVDLLLLQSGRMKGNTEHELRMSMAPKPRPRPAGLKGAIKPASEGGR